MKHEPLTSIIVNNHNYGRYLREAIDSALAQTYPQAEVIVVDDGSTDDSPEIIAGYGERIVAVLKENGGQASAFNAGFANCRGEVICFLDSDDLFREDKVAETVRLLNPFRIEGKDVLLYHDLEVVDRHGSLLGTTKLSGRRFKTNLPPNLYRHACEHGYILYAAGPTSGLALTRSLAERIFPIPEAGIRTSADNFVVKAASLLGEVHEAKAALSKYRVHGENNWFGKQDPHPETFVKQEEEFLNQKLEENGKEPVLSFFDSMYSRRWHAHHQRYGGLMRLAFKVPARRLNLRTLRFSATVVAESISLALRSGYEEVLRSLFGAERARESATRGGGG